MDPVNIFWLDQAHGIAESLKWYRQADTRLLVIPLFLSFFPPTISHARLTLGSGWGQPHPSGSTFFCSWAQGKSVGSHFVHSETPSYALTICLMVLTCQLIILTSICDGMRGQEWTLDPALALCKARVWSEISKVPMEGPISCRPLQGLGAEVA